MAAMPEPRYVVTGASGFVGARLMAALDGPRHGIALSAPDWRRRVEEAPFAGAVVLHLAARAHRGGNAGQFRHDNVEKTRALAEVAARAGARRFVFLSSIKVNGETTASRPFSPADVPAPGDDYGRSKRDAEIALAEVAASLALPVVIVRCPLVYGAPAKGNLAMLLRICDSPLPLPFGAIDNRRSFIAVDDLCRALLRCAHVEEAVGKTYLVAHREPISTPRLVSHVRRALGRPARLFRMPPSVLEGCASVAGLGDTVKRLTRSLEVDPSLAERDLGWRAQVGIEEAVGAMVNGYRERGA